MSQQLADNFLPTTTGYDLGSPTQQWDVYAQDFTCSGTALFSGALAITSLEGIQFADQAAGATVTNKIDTALAAATNVVVLVPSTMGAGNATAIATGKSILDLRGGLPKWFTNVSVSTPALKLADNGVLTFTTLESSSLPLIATTGTVRLGHNDDIKIRSNAGTVDLNILKMNSITDDILVLGDPLCQSVYIKGIGTFITGSLDVLGGAITNASYNISGYQLESLVATGTAPLIIASTTVVPNLNVATLNGVTVSGAASSGKVLTASSASAASWASPAVGTSTILDKQDVIAAKTGDSTDQTVYTYSMPSGTMAAGKGIRITFYGLHNSGSAAVTYQVWFGATSVSSIIGTASTNQQQWVHAMVFNNTGSTTAQWSEARNMESATPSGPVATSPAENTNGGSPIVIKATFNVANTDQVTGKGWLVELIT